MIDTIDARLAAHDAREVADRAWHRDHASDRQEVRRDHGLHLSAGTNGIDRQGRPVDGDGRLLGDRVPWCVGGRAWTPGELTRLRAAFPGCAASHEHPMPGRSAGVEVRGEARRQEAARAAARAAADEVAGRWVEAIGAVPVERDATWADDEAERSGVP